MNTINKETLIANGGKYWEKGEMHRVYINMQVVEKMDLGINFNEKKHKLFFDCDTCKFDGSSETFARALNANL